MSNGDPVTQQQFADTMRADKKEILIAIERVNGHVQDTRVDVSGISVKLDSHEKRMDALDSQADNQKNWNRGLAVVEAGVVAALAALGLRDK